MNFERARLPRLNIAKLLITFIETDQEIENDVWIVLSHLLLC